MEQTLKERYLDHLATEGGNARSPAEFGRTSLKNWANADKGAVFQNEVRDALRVPRGTGSGHHEIGGYRIDLPPGAKYGVTDIKNVAELEKTPQINAFIQHAKANKLPLNFIVSPETKYIASTIIREVRATGGVIFEFNPARGTFTLLDLPKSGVWKR